MQHAIVEKLNRELVEPITSERQVVYILAEVRKLIEANGDLLRLSRLAFFCHWVLHPNLKGLEAQRIVDLFNTREKLWHDTEHRTGPVEFNKIAVDDLQATVELKEFRSEFVRFCAEQGITGSLVDSEEEWAAFLTYYAYVVRDCPLMCENKALSFVKKVVVEVVPQLGPDGKIQKLAMTWRWKSEQTGALCSQVLLLPAPREGMSANELRANLEDVKTELANTQQHLSDFECPLCQAALNERAVVDLSEDYQDLVERYDCGHEIIAGRMQRPCPRDRRFPALDDYDLEITPTEPMGEAIRGILGPGYKPALFKCVPHAKTPIAERVRLEGGYGDTPEEARAGALESYAQLLNKAGRKTIT